MIDRRFDVTPTALDGVMIVRRQRVGDGRGYLSRIYCREELAEAGLKDPIAQINQTMTRERGTIRGMHFQRPPHAESKLVSCLRGDVWDVAVDLRKGSSTFLSWHAERLSEDNGTALLIPRGFAHGFQALSDQCELLYLHTASFAPSLEGAVNAFDPTIAIEWPLAVTAMSDRDRSHPFIDANYSGIE
jgi:dTDP-4-dehydrorhamnose 3,5-epimerase